MFSGVHHWSLLSCDVACQVFSLGAIWGFGSFGSVSVGESGGEGDRETQRGMMRK